MNDTSTLSDFTLTSTLTYDSIWNQTLGLDLEEV